MRILQWSHFVPAYDVWFDKFVKDWGAKSGVQVRVDRIPHLELPSRIAAEFAAGSGHDLIYFVGTILTGLYYKNLADLSDIVDKIGQKWGGWLPSADPIARVEGRWYALPDFYIVAPMLWRKDLFDQSGLKPPDTWELARVAGRTLKPKGHPCGIAFSQCNDANLFLRTILFSHGAKEFDPSGQQVLLDSKETREGLRFVKALFDEAMTPEVFSWDDASDNRYLASGVACWVHDAISAYRTTEDSNPPVFQNTHVGLVPQGSPGLRVSIANPNAYAVWKFSKNLAVAKEFLEHLADNWKDGMIGSRGYNMPFFREPTESRCLSSARIPSSRSFRSSQTWSASRDTPGRSRRRSRRSWPPSCFRTCARASRAGKVRTRRSVGRSGSIAASWPGTGAADRAAKGRPVASSGRQAPA